MKRKAILIHAAGQQTDKDYLEGAKADVKNFREYLNTNAGGAWEYHEIEVLENKSKAEIMKAIAAAKSSDYTLVTASGHGHHVKGKGVDETRFCVNKIDEIAAHELNTGSSRCSVIIDCCRMVTIQMSLVEQWMTKAAMESRSEDIHRARFRAIYDDAVLGAEIGCSYFFSCDLNEAAQESKDGGYYSGALITCAEDWHSKSMGKGLAILDILDAHRSAAEVVTKREPQQHPQHQAGRRRKYFPFGIAF